MRNDPGIQLLKMHIIHVQSLSTVLQNLISLSEQYPRIVHMCIHTYVSTKR